MHLAVHKSASVVSVVLFDYPLISPAYSAFLLSDAPGQLGVRLHGWPVHCCSQFRLLLNLLVRGRWDRDTLYQRGENPHVEKHTKTEMHVNAFLPKKTGFEIPAFRRSANTDQK